MKTKEFVHLRQKKLANGNMSLYLDIYYNGRRSYEFLKLYLIPERDRNAKTRNNETMRLAEAVKAKRIIDIQNGTYGFGGRPKSKTPLLEYAAGIVAQKGEGTGGTYRNLLVRIEEYFGSGFPVEKLTARDVRAFYDCLLKSANRNYNGISKPLSRTTIHGYCNVFKLFVRQAVRDSLLDKDVTIGVDVVTPSESVRQYLTIDEVQMLCSGDIGKPFKRAFLFSCLTGLRKSDIAALTWGDVITQDGFTRIVFRQRKTKSLEYLDISPQAVPLMGERGRDGDKVFEGFSYHNCNVTLAQWLQEAGIRKRITFHCARHTFAVMMLTLGVDIYTTSKLLGHRELSTTQIYAKIIDEKKRDAVLKIPVEIKTPPVAAGGVSRKNQSDRKN